MDNLHFFVPGKTITSGSKRSFYNKKTGKTVLTPDNTKQKVWQASVGWFAKQAFEGQTPWSGPLSMTMVFVRARPGNHFGTGRNEGKLKSWAAKKRPTTRPDVLKLGRAVEDAMSEIIYIDDSQIVEEHLNKVYGAKPGVDITITRISERPASAGKETETPRE